MRGGIRADGEDFDLVVVRVGVISEGVVTGAFGGLAVTVEKQRIVMFCQRDTRVAGDAGEVLVFREEDELAGVGVGVALLLMPIGEFGDEGSDVMSLRRAAFERQCGRIRVPTASPVDDFVVREIVGGGLFGDRNRFDAGVVPGEGPVILEARVIEPSQPIRDALRVAVVEFLGEAIEEDVVGVEVAAGVGAFDFVGFSGRRLMDRKKTLPKSKSFGRRGGWSGRRRDERAQAGVVVKIFAGGLCSSASR